MKTIDIFVVDDSGEVVDQDTYNVLKVLQENQETTTLLVLTYIGDVAVVRANKDYSVQPYRLVVRNKFMLPFIDSQEVEE